MLPSKILVNVHEPQQIIDHLQQYTPVEVKNFTPGDYIVGEFALERKTLGDFLGSLYEKRMFEQLSRLKRCYSKSFLLLEADQGLVTNFRVFYGTVLRVLLHLDMKVIFTQNHQQTAEVLLLLAGRSSLYPFIRQLPKKTSLTRLRFDLLRKIPMVGKHRAQQLLYRFDTLHNLYTANEEELLKVQGIGEKTIENIKKV